MTPIPKHRWLRWFLGTLFVVLTAFGVGLGWQVGIVQQRKHLLHEIKSAGGHYYLAQWPLPTGPMGMGRADSHPELVPWWRVWLGDERINEINVPDHSSREYVEHVRAVFPDAMVGPPPTPH
jgi:hypothetical protein